MRSYTGIVKEGTQRALALGFPTVNIGLSDADISGIYASRVKVGSQVYIAAAFADPERKLLEAYILDFSDVLYGKEITIELHKKIRENMIFERDDALCAAIADDVIKVREYFKI